MKQKGFYDLLLKLNDQIEDNYVVKELTHEKDYIKDWDDYLVKQFNNNFLLTKLKSYTTLEEKLAFLNSLISKTNVEEQLLPQILLKIHDDNPNEYHNTIRLTDNHLFTNQNAQELINELNKEIRTADEVNFIFPFISKAILNKIEASIAIANKCQTKIRLITTTFDNMAAFVNLEELTRLVITYDNFEIRVEDNLEKRSERIHIKTSIFRRKSGFGTAIIGSSNLTYRGMVRGREWNIKVNEFANPKLYEQLLIEYETIWTDRLVNFNNPMERADLLNRIHLAQEEIINNQFNQTTEFLTTRKYLYDFQKEIVNKLKKRRKQGKNKHLIIMATGTGKTVVSAFDYKNQIKENNNIKPTILFLAHQKEIIDQALLTFQSVLRDKSFGEVLYEQMTYQNNYYLFATIQTIHNRLSDFDPQHFDIIIFDEAHHIASKTFDRVFNYFKPKQLLGLTATPERTDGKTILKYFDNEFASELRLWDAVNQRLLCPFDYYCIDDPTSDLTGVDLNNDEALFQKLNTTSRNELLYQMINKYLGHYAKPMCVIFCITTEHARIVTKFLTKKGLKASYLTSEVNSNRTAILNDFKKMRINYLCVVNMFNEGIDVPEIDTIIMLRPTNSKTIYLQQLGRGLRKTDHKSRLEVYDLITNVDKKYDLTLGIKNLFANNLTSRKMISENQGLPYGCTITLEKRSQEIILRNLRKWYDNKNRIRLQVREFYQKYGPEGLYKILETYEMSLLEFYNILNDFYLKVAQNITLYNKNENDHQRNKNIFKQFLFLNSYDIVWYFYHRLKQSLPPNQYQHCYDNLLMCSLLYEVTSMNAYEGIFPNYQEIEDLIDYFIEHNQLIVNELLLILKYKLDHEVLIARESHQQDSLLYGNWTFTVRQALCIIERTNFIPSKPLRIIAFQAGHLTFDETKLVILADTEVINYGKLTKYDFTTKEYWWSLPEQMKINNKLVKDIQNPNITKYLFLQNKINHPYSNLKLKLYDFIGIGKYLKMVNSDILTAEFSLIS